MKIPAEKILIAILLLLPLFSLSQQKDSVFLYKGQVLIGNIKNVDLGVITIDDVDLKLISIKLYKIKMIKTVHRFRIETNDKEIYFGTLNETGKNGWIEIMADNKDTVVMRITGINTMIFLGKTFFKRLDGNIGAGFSYTKASGIGQFNFNSSISYVTPKLENQFKASTIGSIDSSKYSRDNENAELFSNYNFNTTWFAAGMLSYQRNLELMLKRRFQQFLGAGNKLIVRKNLQLLAISGISLSQEKNTQNIQTGPLVEVPAILRFNYYKFQHPNIQISSSQSVYFGITEKGRIRYSGSTDFSWELIKDFSFTFSLYNNFDNKSSGSSTDFGAVMGLSYKF